MDDCHFDYKQKFLKENTDALPISEVDVCTAGYQNCHYIPHNIVG
jgi:hypothetical protein